MNEADSTSGNFISDWLRLWVGSTEDYSIFALGPDGRILTWNRGAELMHGYLADEIVGQPVSALYPDAEREAGEPAAALRAAEDTGRFVAEGRRQRKDGTPYWANVVITALRAPDGSLMGFGEVVRDVSDKKAVHDAVLESEQRFRLLVQGVTDYAIFMLSPDGHVSNWNEGARRIKGYTEAQIVGTHFSRFYTPEDIAAGVPYHGLETARRDGRFEAEGWRVRRDGSRFWAHVVIDAIRQDGELIGFAKVTRDITERRQAAELLEQTRSALFQAQKMEALGKLTGGVAHDFNNVLQVLRGNLELLESRHSRDLWSRDRLSKAIDAVERGARLASHLLAFGRRQALQPVVVNPARLLHSIDDLLRRALGEPIEIETVVAGGLWNTSVDAHQLENVILNLAINARDAMPEGGKLTLEIANAMLDDSYVAAYTDVAAGQYVMLAVTDTGTGMTHDVAERAFDPFFTTKPEGQGTGLGLSMAYGFVKQSGGHIRIYSEPGHGTTIKIYLRRSTEAASDLRPMPGGGVRRGNETVLVVEDDLKVQSTVIDMLSGLGYTVLKADDAQQALAVVGSGVHIDLLFTDVVMPGPLRSPDMARRAKEAMPHLKVLFTSGYTQNAIVHGGRLDQGVELLSKPYSREQLAFKVRQVLGPASPAVEESEATEVAAAAAKAAADAEPQARRVLVVEDDAASLEAVSELLTMMGHTPVKAATPVAALESLRSQTFDVLLTDVMLPGMSGIDLARHAVDIQHDVKVIFASGNTVSDRGDLGFAWTALRKPYPADALIAAIQAVCAHG
ncbi:PAS domain S-box protein [Paraburkholderia sp.]|uniref:hybrid sensor histidine kinase/response regulator n=1 Tax=Paraburkholderia sp. TaxID=1926495 RepID=UPI0023A1DF48|nr:PAS domain S-box protein [Paraburkholderia sp.]MDE1184719.1 PAS domain S-box protein [Paraburkholderia sp.]